MVDVSRVLVEPRTVQRSVGSSPYQQVGQSVGHCGAVVGPCQCEQAAFDRRDLGSTGATAFAATEPSPKLDRDRRTVGVDDEMLGAGRAVEFQLASASHEYPLLHPAVFERHESLRSVDALIVVLRMVQIHGGDGAQVSQGAMSGQPCNIQVKQVGVTILVGDGPAARTYSPTPCVWRMYYVDIMDSLDYYDTVIAPPPGCTCRAHRGCASAD
jgi:hypothetical protein